MAQRYFIFIDATPQSHAPFFDESPIFQTWLKVYNDVSKALKFISEVTLPYSVKVYLARDNILDDGLRSPIDNQMRTLIETLSDLNVVHRITVFCPNMNNDPEVQIRAIVGDPRSIDEVIAVDNLPMKMCTEGISYFIQQISRCKHGYDTHILPNFRENMRDLVEYLKTVMNERRPEEDALVEQHSNKPGEEVA
ncbi:unnamed protein product [Rotaria magnacalcarata]|uniref:Uncharacterized protein n=1 Tax=Rotaria magnacalcarata TaxID=392030 RepID=A0A815V8X1_9BILA|nr:unnamed protein product [Rotaria magnacalcarata]CAF1647887.1 unnamed protein product [Rotaria magnacalcarata]CAF2080320.1 unnamed protein product [Rotaria magnacalcarata]CAF4080288.1 unnamed protein product [Rotaria magnacalcarata]CAF4521410.1 unnamed protein product [Rotaria magnacalcarata]